jgi:2-dehydropantoate 2-reductase
VPAIESLNNDKAYDLVIVLVRKDQIASVLPTLALFHNAPCILFMVNNPSGYDDWISAVGRERLMLGFAGAGGTRVDGIVR